MSLGFSIFVVFHRNRDNEQMKFFKGIEVEEAFFLFLFSFVVKFGFFMMTMCIVKRQRFDVN